jgi:hypothetical protein
VIDLLATVIIAVLIRSICTDGESEQMRRRRQSRGQTGLFATIFLGSRSIKSDRTQKDEVYAGQTFHLRCRAQLIAPGQDRDSLVHEERNQWHLLFKLRRWNL